MSKQGEKNLKQQAAQNSLRNEYSTSLTNLDNIQQQEYQINVKEKQDSAQQVKNIAICVACSKYNIIYENLECPKKDQELISNCLSQFNFEIIKCLDKSVSEIENELNKLKSQIQESKGYYNQIFFYYSGHGCIKKNDSNQNITFGLDSEAKHIELVKYAVELASLSNSVCFAFFDCCRVEIKGFKRIKQDYSNNLMLLFSCEENKESAGTSRGSISTLQFIQRIKKQDTQKISLSKQICVTEFLNKFKGEFYDNSKFDFILTQEKVSKGSDKQIFKNILTIKQNSQTKISYSLENKKFSNQEIDLKKTQAYTLIEQIKYEDLVVSGGQDENRFDLHSEIETLQYKMQFQRFNHRTSYDRNENIYIISGQIRIQLWEEGVQECEVFNLNSKQFQKIAQLENSTINFGCDQTFQELYTFGGYSLMKGHKLDFIQYYDKNADK